MIIDVFSHMILQCWLSNLQSFKIMPNDFEKHSHCVSIRRISPHSVRMWENAGTRITPNTDTFYAVSDR